MQRHIRVYDSNFVKWAKDKPEVVALSGDLTGGCELRMFQEAYPDRFYSMGIAEQNMHSFAGGMASEGFIPFVHTFAVFIYRRSLDQVTIATPRKGPVPIFRAGTGGQGNHGFIEAFSP